ncbi:MAG: hypothetical protein H0X67_02460 [Acidobacteria bacterium]|nr:hypothetical protein [Acidobacteriota bacterium]
MGRPRIDRPYAAPSPGVVGVLLSGWRAAHDAPPDEPGLFELFQGDQPAVARLWRRHEAFLLGEAARLGIEPPYELADGRVLFFGQFCDESRAVQHEHWLRRSAEVIAALDAGDEGDDPAITHEDTP